MGLWAYAGAGQGLFTVQFLPSLVGEILNQEPPQARDTAGGRQGLGENALFQEASPAVLSCGWQRQQRGSEALPGPLVSSLTSP